MKKPMHYVAILVALLSARTAFAQNRTLQPGQWFSVVYSDSMRRVLLVNGGPVRGGKSPNAPVEIWSWDGSNWTLVAADSTGPRWRNYAIATYDSRRNVVVLFGGLQYGLEFDDTWEWNGRSWVRRSAQGPGPRVSAEAAFDKARGVTIMFGGNHGEQLLSDTWTLDGTKWSVLPTQTAGPSPRGSHTLVYDDARRVTLMYGGHFPSMTDGKNFSEFWEWNGARWRLIESRAPSPGIRVNARAA